MTCKTVAAYYRELVDQAVSDFDGDVAVEGGPNQYTIRIADFPRIAVTRGALLECPPFDPEPDVDAERKSFDLAVLSQQLARMLSGAKLPSGLGQPPPKRFYTPR